MCMILDYLKFVLRLILLIAFLKPAYAEESLPAGSKTEIPGAEFTKMQDIDPAGTGGDNRPVKQKWAVVIGLSKFKESRLTPVEVSDLDKSAREFYEYLIDSKAGRFPVSHVKLLLNSNATRQNIMSSLGPGFLGPAVGADDLVLIYVSTSAFPTTDGNTYLCAYDCALDNIYATCISMQTLMDTLRKNLQSNRIVLVLQAAYSGAAELESGAKAIYSGFNIDINKVVLGKGYIILSSSRPNEITWGSSFSNNLIKALKTENGLVGLQKAFAIAQLETEKETLQKGVNRKQTPVFKSDWSGNELVLGTPALEKMEELPEAVLKFQSAESQYLKATQSMTVGKIDEALGHYELAISINPNYADALADYGAANALKGDWQKAADLYERALLQQPADGLFRLNYARVLSKLGNEEKCLNELEKAHEYSPKDITVLEVLAGRILASEPDRAVNLLKEAIALYPARASLHERLSLAYARSGKAESALVAAREAVRLDADSSSSQMNLGTVLMMNAQLEQAIVAYKKAARIAPENADARYFLARALEKSGDKPAASAEYNEFLRLANASDQRLAAVKQKLKELAE